MSYAVGEAALLTLVRALSGYDATNSGRVDWRLLDSGQASTYAVLKPGEWKNAQVAYTVNVRTWRTVVEMWRLYRDDGSPIQLQADVETMIVHLEKYPTLNGAAGVIDAMIIGGGEMHEVTRANNSLWLRWEVYIDWQEEADITYAE